MKKENEPQITILKTKKATIMDNSNNILKVIGTLFAGAVIGSAVGILFAPYKGSKTRSKISGSTKDIAKEIKKTMKGEAKFLSKKVSELETIAENKLKALSLSAKSKVDEIKSAL